jgi:hypothetical protein
MRDKIVIRGKGAYNTTKRPPAQKRKRKRERQYSAKEKCII